MTTYFNQAPQQVSITIPTGATSATATITAVGALAFIINQGFSCTSSTANAQTTDRPRLELTNSTTVTAYRNTSSGSLTITANAVVIDATSALVNSVQNGTVSITAGTSGTATVTSVSTTGSSVFWLDGTTSTSTGTAAHLTAVALTSPTQITATVHTSGTHTVGFCLVEWNPAVLQSNIQQISDAYTTSNSTDTKTITSVTANNTIIAWGGINSTASNFADGCYYAQLTTGTNVNLVRSGTSATSRQPFYTIVEFISGVLNSAIQRGSIALNSASSNTATTSSVSLAYSVCNYTGHNTSGISSDAPRSMYPRVTLTNPTTITANKNTAALNTSVGYELWEFIAPVTGIAFDAASNSGYQTAQSTYSWNHTITGSNTYLVVGIAMLSVAGSTVSGITFNGISMDFLGAKSSVTGAMRTELWGQTAPSSGTHSIVVTLSAGLDSAGGAVSYTGVNQSSPTEALNTAQATNVGAADATVNVTTVGDNDWVVDCVATTDTAITIGTGNTSRSNVTGTLGSGAVGDNNTNKTPAGSVTMSWTNVAALATWAIVAIAIRPTADANIASKVFRKTLSVIGTKVGVRQVMGW